MTDHQWGLPHSTRGSDLKRLWTPVTSPPAEAAIAAFVATHPVALTKFKRKPQPGEKFGGQAPSFTYRTNRSAASHWQQQPRALAVS